MATPADFDGNFLFCRILFRNAPDGDGGGWGVDYPRADINLTFRLSELSKTPVTRDERDGYNHVVVRLTDPLLYHCPFVMMTEPGGAYFDEAEAAALRDYMVKGGFLWADDFWGEYAFRHWAEQIGKAFPRRSIPSSTCRSSIALSRALRHPPPRADSVDRRVGRSGHTRQNAAATAPCRTCAPSSTKNGRIMVLMTHNTDFGDAFEREGDDHEYFLEFAPDGYAFGVNAIIYSMTH